MNAARPERLLLGGVSLLLGLLLWLQVSTTESPAVQREVSVALDIRNVPDNLMPVDPPARVALVFEGSQAELDALAPEQWVAFVDAANATAGRRQLDVRASGPVAGRLQYRPRQPVLTIAFDPVVRSEFAVEIETRGRRPEDLRYDGAAVMPERVTVAGPASAMRDVRVVRASLDLSRIRPGVSTIVPVEVLGDGNRPIPQAKAEPPTVTVFPAVAAAPATGSVLVTPVFRGAPAFGYRVAGYEIAPLQVMLTGESDALAAVRTIETSPIDLTGRRESAVLSVGVQVPEGLRLRTPGAIRVTVRIEPKPALPAEPPADRPGSTPAATGGDQAEEAAGR